MATRLRNATQRYRRSVGKGRVVCLADDLISAFSVSGAVAARDVQVTIAGVADGTCDGCSAANDTVIIPAGEYYEYPIAAWARLCNNFVYYPAAVTYESLASGNCQHFGTPYDLVVDVGFAIGGCASEQYMCNVTLRIDDAFTGGHIIRFGQQFGADSAAAIANLRSLIAGDPVTLNYDSATGAICDGSGATATVELV